MLALLCTFYFFLMGIHPELWHPLHIPALKPRFTSLSCQIVRSEHGACSMQLRLLPCKAKAGSIFKVEASLYITTLHMERNSTFIGVSWDRKPTKRSHDFKSHPSISSECSLYTHSTIPCASLALVPISKCVPRRRVVLGNKL